MKDTDEKIGSASSSLKKIPDDVLKKMWEYLMTTSAVPKLIEKYEKEQLETQEKANLLNQNKKDD
ncbi:hypothetical protein [Sporosarcina jiandibaonis]|uniref:hypothetical protein n=1 Tax=Sporosarcina jiandibaonis TaxID=2715535 RepID=UPI001554A83E|nr:hypothetical protein [Sporosarcina jiandibaonis]